MLVHYSSQSRLTAVESLQTHYLDLGVRVGHQATQGIGKINGSTAFGHRQVILLGEFDNCFKSLHSGLPLVAVGLEYCLLDGLSQVAVWADIGAGVAGTDVGPRVSTFVDFY